jgi:hypothetical protein
MAAHIALPWIHRLFSSLKRWGLGSNMGCGNQAFQHYLDEFVFASIGAARGLLPVTPCSASAPALHRLPYHVLIRKAA